MKKFCLGLVFVLAFVFFSVQGNAAPGKNFYTVEGIKVSASSVSSSEAKKRALEDARTQAFNIVVARVLLKDDVEKVLFPGNYNLEKFVQAMKLKNEKTTSSSYSADVDIQINKNLMVEYLKNQGLSAVADVPPSTLVVFKGGDSFGFADSIGATNIVPVMTYLESSFNFDVDDASLAKFQSVINAINNVVVVEVVPGRSDYTVFVKDKIFGIDKSRVVSTGAAVPGAVLDIVNESYKRAMLSGENTGRISLLVPVYSLADWLDIEKKFSKLSVFKDMELQALKFNRAQLKVKYNYDLNSVISALTSLGLSVENNGSFLVIKR